MNSFSYTFKNILKNNTLKNIFTNTKNNNTKTNFNKTFTLYSTVTSITTLTSLYYLNYKYINNNNNNTLQCRDKEGLKNLSKKNECLQELSIEELEQKYPNLKLVKSIAFTTLLGQIRDKTVDTNEFRRISKRMIRILIEEALAYECTEEIIKESPCSYYLTKTNPNLPEDYIVVSILRSGDCILEEFLNIVPEIKVGKILVQRNEQSKEKEAIYFFDKLPSGIKGKKAFVVDPMIATGGSAIASIDILVKKGINPKDITFINVVACEEGLRNLSNKFPGLKIVTGVCDPVLLDIKYIAPGLGDFGDRFYGTF